ELWQVSDINKNYTICSTYPQNLILPKKISPSLINHLKNYRDQQRFPILSHFNGKNVLLRCAQPMMGVLNKNSIQDENLIKEYIKTADSTSMELNNKSKLMIVDCRPLKNAMAQQYIMGGGSEQVLNYQYADIPGKYDTTKKLFLNMPNIHIVSSQFEQIFLKYTLNGIKSKSNLINEEGEQKEDEEDDEQVIVFNPLDFNWYETIANVLENLDYLLKEYLLNSTHFLIHCTHGWDRTSMLTSLMMICSDPFYRTIKGFFLLIQLEWLDYGFRFAERFDVKVSNMSNELESMDSFAEEEMEKEEKVEEIGEQEEEEEDSKPKGGKSPVMIHFLDLVWQIVNQQPDKFEYNEFFLLKFLDNVVSGKFSEFINDCDMERKGFFKENGFSSNDYHWSKFFEINQNYINKNFKQLGNENIKCDEEWIFPDSKKVAIW
ncbi:phosphatases II, partial [Hanseniaspora valbyensis NRRL Y-1626]